MTATVEQSKPVEPGIMYEMDPRDRLREIRERLGWSRRYLAGKLRTDNSTIYRWETHKAQMALPGTVFMALKYAIYESGLNPEAIVGTVHPVPTIGPVPVVGRPRRKDSDG